MRKVELRMNEEYKYRIIKKLIETNGNKKTAAVKLNSSKKEKQELRNQLVLSEDAHPRQPRCQYFGEELQMDACIHLWFGREKTALHAAIDDATGQVVGLYFDNDETLNGYYNITHQILSKYGIPYLIKTDKRTVFEYQKYVL